MDRTMAPGNVDRRYIDEDRNVGVQGTAIIAADRNAVQEELIHLIEGGGLAPNAGDETQVLHAVREIARVMPPIGTIWMYDGTDWVDDVTLPGWYACIPENEDGGVNGLTFGIRSMVDRFVMASSTAAIGVTGGANSYQLAVSQLPAHTHTINHDHGSFLSGAAAPSHSHDIPSLNHRHNTTLDGPRGASGSSAVFASTNWSPDIYTAYTNPDPGSTGSASPSHTHNVTVPVFDGDSGFTGLGGAVENRPAFYSMLFIRRCT